MDRGAWWAPVHEVAKSQTQFSNQTTVHNGLLRSHKKGMKYCHLQQFGWTYRLSY